MISFCVCHNFAPLNGNRLLKKFKVCKHIFKTISLLKPTLAKAVKLFMAVIYKCAK
jgi:hypothetical protein